MSTTFILNIKPEDTLSKLDFPTILQELKQYCYGSLGEEWIDQQAFMVEPELLRKAVRQVVEFKDILENDPYFPERGFNKLPFLKTIKIPGAVLSVDEFVQLVQMLKAFYSVRYFFKQEKRKETYPHLVALTKGVYWDDPLMKELVRVIDIDKNIVKATASEELQQIRRNILKVERQQLGEFAKVLRRYRAADYLAEQGEGVRNGRKVLAVKAEFKRSIQGIYHDDSVSGTIAFIEPIETVTLNNELNTLRRSEEREIDRILRVLLDFVRPHLKSFYIYQDILAQYDANRAKALLAIQLKANAPEISTNGEYQLFRFKHPLLYLNYQEQGKKVVENTLLLEPNERILLISGPNAGGKSVVLKSVGLMQLMFQFGMLIPADLGSKLPVFKQLFVDIGDAQSVENDLSTYSSHLKNMKYFTKHADKDTLVLLDELGHGTDPILGGAMAEAVMDRLLSKKVCSIVTTHYANLKAWGSRTKGVQNGAMGFDKKHLSPLYQLHIGSPGSSFTFEIATKIGLDPALIKEAKGKIGEQSKEMEMSLTEIQHEKQYVKGIRKVLQQREKQLADLQKTYEQLKSNIEKEKKNIIREFKAQTLEEFKTSNRELEKLMREWQEDKKDKEKFLKAKSFIEQARKELKEGKGKVVQPKEEWLPSLDEIINIGSQVRIQNSATVGEVIEIRKNKAVVSFGSLTSLVNIDKLELVNKKKRKTAPQTYKSVQKLPKASTFNTELDLRGKMKTEAMEELEHFLDHAMMYGHSMLRIIHGRGTGVVRQVVQSGLKQHPSVERFEFGSPEHGGDGVTIVFME